MTEYYFAGTFIPKLQIGAPPEISIESYSSLLKENLRSSDYQRLIQLRRFFDIENIRLYWMEKPINPYGNFDAITLEEALINESGFPDYVYEYIHKYDSKLERLRNFAKVFADFFNEGRSGFLKELFMQERALHLILVGLRAKNRKRPLLPELQFENPDDDLSLQMMAQKDANSYEPPEEFSEVKTIYEKYHNNPLEMHQELVKYRFQKIESMIGLQVFTLDRLLAYYFQLVLMHQWFSMDSDKGIKIIQGIS